MAAEAEAVASVVPGKELGEEVPKTGVEAEVLPGRQRRRPAVEVEAAPGRMVQEPREQRTWTMASVMLARVAAFCLWAEAVPWTRSASSSLDLRILRGAASEAVQGSRAPLLAGAWVQKTPEASALNSMALLDLTDKSNPCSRPCQSLPSSSAWASLQQIVHLAGVRRLCLQLLNLGSPGRYCFLPCFLEEAGQGRLEASELPQTKELVARRRLEGLMRKRIC